MGFRTHTPQELPLPQADEASAPQIVPSVRVIAGTYPKAPSYLERALEDNYRGFRVHLRDCIKV